MSSRTTLLIEMNNAIERTPWDSSVLGLETYEIKVVSEEILKTVVFMPGHFTVKIDPLASKKLLHEFEFYYCDTLVEPYCDMSHFQGFDDRAVGISYSVPFEDLVGIAHGAFVHGRFHRDFNIEKRLADIRYENWLRQLHDAGNAFALSYNGAIAGFFAIDSNKIVLHAVGESFRGKGLAKYLWTAGCRELFDKGHSEITSSISASNVTILNVYASLGFRFRKPVDVYHRVNSRDSIPIARESPEKDGHSHADH